MLVRAADGILRHAQIQRGEHRTVCPVEPGPRISAAQHGDLMAQHEQLRVLGGRRTIEQHEPAADPMKIR